MRRHGCGCESPVEAQSCAEDAQVGGLHQREDSAAVDSARAHKGNTMKKIKILDRVVAKSDGSGGAATLEVNVKLDALPYKSLSYYLDVTNVESETATFVGVGYVHGPDGENWTSGTLLRTAAATPRATYAGPATAADITGAAMVSFYVTVEDGVASAEQFAEMSLWVVLKPF